MLRTATANGWEDPRFHHNAFMVAAERHIFMKMPL